MKQTMSLLGGAAGPGRVGAPPENAVRFAPEPGSLSSPRVSSPRTNAGAVAGYGRGREWRRRNKPFPRIMVRMVVNSVVVAVLSVTSCTFRHYMIEHE